MRRAVFCLHAIAFRLREFAKDTRGSLSVETAVVMPFLLGLFALTFVWFDAFRTKNAVLKATYGVSDMISRETASLPDTYFAGLTTIFRFMIGTTDDATLRITTVKCTADCDDDTQRKLEMCWSWASQGLQEHNETTFKSLEDAIPLMVLGDTVVVTEGSVDYEPLFKKWLDDIEIRNTIVTRPRFAPQVALGDERCYAEGGDSTSGTDDDETLD